MTVLEAFAKAVGYLVTVGGAIAGFVKFCFWVYDEVQKRKESSAQGFVTPRKTLTLSLQPERSCWWHMGSMGQDAIMQVVGHFTVTNIYSKSVRVTQAELRHGFLGRKRILGDISISLSFGSNHYGSFPIPPSDTRNASFDFWVYPPVEKEKHGFIARSVTLTDHFGNRHVVKKVRFVYM